MRGGIEKSKDFKGSMIKIINSLKPWYKGIIISLVLAFISAILALIAPNKLSKLADYITEGITPRISQEKITEIMNNPSISNEDKQILINIMSSFENKDNNQELLLKIEELPTSIYNEIKPIMNMQKIKNISLLWLIFPIVILKKCAYQ